MLGNLLRGIQTKRAQNKVSPQPNHWNILLAQKIVLVNSQAACESVLLCILQSATTICLQSLPDLIALGVHHQIQMQQWRWLVSVLQLLGNPPPCPPCLHNLHQGLGLLQNWRFEIQQLSTHLHIWLDQICNWSNVHARQHLRSPACQIEFIRPKEVYVWVQLEASKLDFTPIAHTLHDTSSSYFDVDDAQRPMHNDGNDQQSNLCTVRQSHHTHLWLQIRMNFFNWQGLLRQTAVYLLKLLTLTAAQ